MRLLEFINELIANNKYRSDCPSCGNKNTFSIKREGLDTYYNCFHINCKLRGRLDAEINIDTLRDINSISSSNGGGRSRLPVGTFVVSNNECSAYLRRFNCNILDFPNLKYDPKEHRLVFPLEYKGENYGYVGRALANHILPKWRTYLRRDGCPFICYKSKEQSAILVEDCISALRGVSITNCIGLLGTSIPTHTIRYLLEFDRLYIALDPDALSKSIELQKILSYYRPTEILILENDLKYYSDEALEKIRKEIE